MNHWSSLLSMQSTHYSYDKISFMQRRSILTRECMWINLMSPAYHIVSFCKEGLHSHLCFLWVRQRISLLKSSITAKESDWETCSSEHWHWMDSHRKYFRILKALLQWTHASHNFWGTKSVLSQSNTISFTFHSTHYISFLCGYLTYLRKYDQFVILKEVKERTFHTSLISVLISF